jgi:FdhD protein
MILGVRRVKRRDVLYTVAPLRRRRGQAIESLDVRAVVLGPRAQALKPLDQAPRLSQAAVETLRAVEVVDEQGEKRSIHVPRERPLTVLLDGRELVTLMTLGGAPEWLVLGYLRNQRMIGEIGTLDSVIVDWDDSTARVGSRLPGPSLVSPKSPVARTACAMGTAFAEAMKAIEGMVLPQQGTASISRSTLLSVLESTRALDDIHRAAGSVHGCALYSGQDLWVSIEDVSRHNGVDAVTGWMALHGVGGGDKILFTTGRLTGEMVMKAAFNGIPILITRNGVTDLGYRIAVQLHMSLFGRAANRRYLCYTDAERFDPNS